MSESALERIRDRRGGYSLVELVLAVVILAVGILGLAGATSWAVRQVNVADLRTERAAVTQTVLERLRAADFDSVRLGRRDATDTVRVGPFKTFWDSREVTFDLAEVRVVTVGPGYEGVAGEMPVLIPDARETFTFRIARP